MSTPTRLLDLSPSKRALLDLLRRERGLEPDPPSQRRPYFPLSAGQEGLWFLDQLEPLNPWYNITVLVELSGKLRVRAMETSLREVIRRHDVLRTRFTAPDGRPIPDLVAQVE